jgi:hypothetical protein
VLGVVVGDPILKPWGSHHDLLPLTGQVEAEQVAAKGQGRGRPGNRSLLVLGPSVQLARNPIPPAARRTSS